MTLAALAMIGGMGCASSGRRFTPPEDPHRMDDTTFTHYLPGVPVVTVGEGWRAILLLRGTPTRGWTTAELRLELERTGIIRPRWRLNPDHVLDHGTLAYMLMTLCKLPRSVNDHLAKFGGLGERRYALKNCIDAGLLPYNVASAPVSGGELLSALSRAEPWLDTPTGPALKQYAGR